MEVNLPFYSENLEAKYAHGHRVQTSHQYSLIIKCLSTWSRKSMTALPKPTANVDTNNLLSRRCKSHLVSLTSIGTAHYLSTTR